MIAAVARNFTVTVSPQRRLNVFMGQFIKNEYFARA